MAVGEALVDLIALEAEDLDSATEFIRAAGGAPANVAVAAARLGSVSAFVGAVGADPFGAFLTGLLRDNGVDTTALRTVPERTTLSLVARNQGGIPNFVFYRGADVTLRPEDVPVAMLARTTFLHVSSMALMSEPSRSATLFAMMRAPGDGALISVDPNLRPSSWPSIDQARESLQPLLNAADVLKVNDEEAQLLSGASDLDEALASLGNQNGLVVITRGARGCLWRWRGATGEVGAPRVEVVDTTGAGDAFVGALLAEMAHRGYERSNFTTMDVQDLEAVLRFAGAAGAFACTEPGAMASLPTRQQVEGLQ